MPKIECLLRRPQGTTVTLGSNTYHFKPDTKGRHVATVDDERDAARLLEIREGYRLYDPKEPAAGRMTAAQQAAETERNTLIEQYQAKFSKDPDPAMTVEQLRAAIEDGTG